MKTLIGILIVIMPATVLGYGITGGRDIGLGGAVLISAPTASELLVCPFAMIEKDRLLIESGYSRKFELSDLEEVYASAGYRFGAVTASVGISQLGRSDYYLEQLLRAGLAASYRDYTIGLIISGKTVEFGNRVDDFRAAAIGVTAGVNHGRYHFGICADNLNHPKIADNSEPDYRRVGIYLELEGPARYSLCGRLLMEEHARPRATVAQYFRLYHDNAIFWHVSTRPMTYGGGVEIAYSRLRVRYAVSHHPALGFTHAVSLGASVFGGK
ncbi:MAG: hypothetical protein JW763_08410 [candidate division Zixibacteria bacterium]|nr:hypothetical protein [candidate division Zixibacteria bacterium]